ncbi:hypothetical protein VTN77DRAFT_2420 [Rasamsonia byssochlamydoides]|uniref:uncharacterized protein n=1 Tax=Rasamsonia byssochlamydoides TaxID=89139 RepID=UPI0037435612
MSDPSPEKAPGKEKLPGFNPVTSKIFVYEPQPQPQSSLPSSVPPPTTIIVFGWGDGQPRHVAKFTDEYKSLYPAARIIGVLSASKDIIFNSRRSAIAVMLPVVALLSSGSSSSGEENVNQEGKASDERVLIHVLSNGGCVNFEATCAAYYSVFACPFPHSLLVLDSALGGGRFVTEVGRMSRAVAVGVLAAFPISRIMPAAAAQTVAQLTCLMWLTAMVGVPELLLGRENPVSVARRSLNSSRHLMDPTAERLYIYSVSDNIIDWKDVERHAAEAAARDCVVRREKFEDSPHVSHLKRHRQRYWDAVTRAWKDAVIKAKI